MAAIVWVCNEEVKIFFRNYLKQTGKQNRACLYFLVGGLQTRNDSGKRRHAWRSIAFLDINVSISGNRLSTRVHYKPTDSNSYSLHSSSHPAHVKNSIPYSQFLRLRRLCSDDTDFSEKAEEMCQFFKTRGYPDPVINNSKHRAQSVHPQSAPLSSHNKVEGRIPLTLTFHPHNISVKNIILKNFKNFMSVSGHKWIGSE